MIDFDYVQQSQLLKITQSYHTAPFLFLVARVAFESSWLLFLAHIPSQPLLLKHSNKMQNSCQVWWKFAVQFFSSSANIFKNVEGTERMLILEYLQIMCVRVYQGYVAQIYCMGKRRLSIWSDSSLQLNFSWNHEKAFKTVVVHYSEILKNLYRVDWREMGHEGLSSVQSSEFILKCFKDIQLPGIDAFGLCPNRTTVRNEVLESGRR